MLLRERACPRVGMVRARCVHRPACLGSIVWRRDSGARHVDEKMRVGCTLYAGRGPCDLCWRGPGSAQLALLVLGDRAATVSRSVPLVVAHIYFIV